MLVRRAVIEVAGFADDIKPCVLKQAGNACSQQEGIFSQHYAHVREARG